MANDREILGRSMERLRNALYKNTGTSFDADEIQVVGKVVLALGTAALGGPGARQACAVCGQPNHGAAEIGSYPFHEYEPGLLVPMPAPEDG